MIDTGFNQGLVKGEKFCFRNLDFYFQHGESTSKASQKSKDSNKMKTPQEKCCQFSPVAPDAAPDFRFVFVWWGNDFSVMNENQIYLI